MTERERLLAALDRSLSVPTTSAIAAAGWSPKTAKRYSGIWRTYDAVALKIGARKLSPVEPLTDDHLALYAVHLGEADLAPRTIRKAMDALKSWHRIHGLPVPSGITALGVTREHDSSLRERGWMPRHTNPVPLDHLVRLLGGCPRSEPAGRRDAALIMLGYSMLTLDELHSLDLPDVLDIGPAARDGLLLRLRARGPGAVVEVRHWVAVDGGHVPALCPVETIAAWRDEILALLVARASTRAGERVERVQTAGEALLRAVDSHGRVGGIHQAARRRREHAARMTQRSITWVFARAVTRAGLAAFRYTLGSLRFGAAEAARAAGGTSTEVAERGGWSTSSPDFALRLASAERDLAGYDGRLIVPNGPGPNPGSGTTDTASEGSSDGADRPAVL